MNERLTRFRDSVFNWFRLLFAWNAKKYASYLVLVACGFITTSVNNCNKKPDEPPEVYVPPTPPTPDIPPFVPGWFETPPDEQERIVNSIPGPKTFANTPAGAAGMDDIFGDSTDAPAWRLANKGRAKARMQPIPVRAQGRLGICVGCASMSTAEYTQAARNYLAKNGAAIELHTFSEEVFYGLMRWEVHGNRRPPGLVGDGATGYWAALAWQKFGVVPRGVYGDVDLTKYSESLGRSYGDRGVPQNLEVIAKQHPGINVTQVKTIEEAKKALGQGYFLLTCSNVGFGEQLPVSRDAEGFLRQNGSWGHAMTVIGYQDGRRPGFLILNSWGDDWVNGPTGRFDDIPVGSFWADERVFLQMLRANDTWALAGVEGFEKRRIKIDDWFVNLPKHPGELVNRFDLLADSLANNSLNTKSNQHRFDRNNFNGVSQHEREWKMQSSIRTTGQTQLATNGSDRVNLGSVCNRDQRLFRIPMFWRRSYAAIETEM